MAPPTCLRCLRRSLRSIEYTEPIFFNPRNSFSTSSLLSAKPAPPKKAVALKPGQRLTKTLRLSKNVRDTSKGKPPAVGERKAVRKRIVLSNTNALEVEGLQDLTVDKLARHKENTVALEKFGGQVLGYNNQTVDALRALESFKPTQAWSFFNRPASLIREETTLLANDMANVENAKEEVVRKVIFGEKRSGKSVLLLQAHAMAFLKGWVVVHFPDGQDLTIAHTAYEPLKTPKGRLYIQPHYTAKLLLNIATANQSVLSKLQLTKQHELPIPVQSNMSLSRFAELGARDPSIAWPVWQALWSELTIPATSQSPRPPILVSMDGVDQAMRMSAYLDEEAKPIHAHDLALVQDFNDLISGETALPNGGMILAATCASNRAASPTLDHCIDFNYTKQRNLKFEGYVRRVSRMPRWHPYAAKDSRVDSVMRDVDVMKVEGLNKEEARGLMAYYAKSGILRGVVTDGLVSEKWTLAGNGIIGELEKCSVRERGHDLKPQIVS